MATRTTGNRNNNANRNTANRNTGNRNNNGSRQRTNSTNSTNRRNTSSSSNAQVRQQPVEANVGASDWWHAFTKSMFFKPCMTIFVILILFGLNMLISLNKFDKFFAICGLEIIVAAFFWIIKLVLSSSSNSSGRVDNTNDNNTSEGN